MIQSHLHKISFGDHNGNDPLYEGTSGDTGSAAINAVRGLQWLDVVVVVAVVVE